MEFKSFDTKGNKAWGYAAGIITGVTYGMNPLFAMPVLKAGVSVDTVLSVRYAVAAIVLAAIIPATGKRFAVTRKQFGWLILLGMLFSSSSLGLFLSYNYIPLGHRDHDNIPLPDPRRADHGLP